MPAWELSIIFQKIQLMINNDGQKNTMKAVICGGHHTSALIIAQRLKEKGYKVLWFGNKWTMLGDNNLSAEYLEVTKEKIPFYEIKAGKFQPNFKFFCYLLRIPFGFVQSLFLLIKERPDIIVSFGGYIALPVALCGYLLGIPIVTHEQTVVFGIANKLIAKVARKIFISFPSSKNYFPPSKVVFTGLPVREEVFAEAKMIFDNGRKTIYVTGGRQGSHIINQAIFENILELISEFNIIHQCGSTTLVKDIVKANKIKEGLGDLGKNYLVKEYFFKEEISQVYRSADFFVSRAGAHTIYELLLLKKPAILIPISWSNNNEQYQNAKLLRDYGLATILLEKDLSGKKLSETIFSFAKNLSEFKLKAKIDFPKNSAELIVKEIEKTVKN